MAKVEGDSGSKKIDKMDDNDIKDKGKDDKDVKKSDKKESADEAKKEEQAKKDGKDFDKMVKNDKSEDSEDKKSSKKKDNADDVDKSDLSEGNKKEVKEVVASVEDDEGKLDADKMDKVFSEKSEHMAEDIDKARKHLKSDMIENLVDKNKSHKQGANVSYDEMKSLLKADGDSAGKSDKVSGEKASVEKTDIEETGIDKTDYDDTPSEKTQKTSAKEKSDTNQGDMLRGDAADHDDIADKLGIEDRESLSKLLTEIEDENGDISVKKLHDTFNIKTGEGTEFINRRDARALRRGDIPSMTANPSQTTGDMGMSGVEDIEDIESMEINNALDGTVETVKKTIVVGKGEVYDGQGITLQADPKKLGDGSQKEDQKPIFKLEDGATLKNVKIGHPGADGIHTYGDAELENIHWLDVGEDALTIKEKGDVVINGGSAQKASDKVFQINAASSLTVNDFYAEDIGKLVRQNGGTDFKTEVHLNNVTVKDASVIAMVDKKADDSKIYYSNLDTSKTKDKFEGYSKGNIKEVDPPRGAAPEVGPPTIGSGNSKKTEQPSTRYLAKDLPDPSSIFVADQNSDQVKLINEEGEIEWEWTAKWGVESKDGKEKKMTDARLVEYDGKPTVLALSSEGRVALVDYESKDVVYERDDLNKPHGAIVAKDHLIVTDPDDGEVQVFDLSKSEKAKAVQTFRSGSAHDVVYDGEHLYVGGGSKIGRFDVDKDGRLSDHDTFRLKGDNASIHGLSLYGDDKIALTTNKGIWSMDKDNQKFSEIDDDAPKRLKGVTYNEHDNQLGYTSPGGTDSHRSKELSGFKNDYSDTKKTDDMSFYRARFALSDYVEEGGSPSKGGNVDLDSVGKSKKKDKIDEGEWIESGGSKKAGESEVIMDGGLEGKKTISYEAEDDVTLLVSLTASHGRNKRTNKLAEIGGMDYVKQAGNNDIGVTIGALKVKKGEKADIKLDTVGGGKGSYQIVELQGHYDVNKKGTKTDDGGSWGISTDSGKGDLFFAGFGYDDKGTDSSIKDVKRDGFEGGNIGGKDAHFVMLSDDSSVGPGDLRSAEGKGKGGGKAQAIIALERAEVYT